MQTIDYRRGLPAMAACFLIWGFQPLYWYMCTNVCGEIDTFFLMACRIIWAAVTCLCILKVQGKLPQLWAVFKDKQVLKRELPASVFLFGDWIVYLWAVQNGRVLECSLGYYIQPLVVFALGAVIFKEKMSWRHFIIIGIVVVGIVLSASGFGGVPYVTIALALMFAVYAAIKKSLTIDSIVSTTSEILMMVPVALLFILFFRMGDNGMGHDRHQADADDRRRHHHRPAHGVLLHRRAEPAADDHRYLPVSQPYAGHRLRRHHGRSADPREAGELPVYLGGCDPVCAEHRL